MKRVLLFVLATVLIAAPLSILATFLLVPFWSWLEATTGIESIGHSGPAGWCYVAIFLLLVAGAALVLRLRSRGRQARGARL
jgi:hypothetical protein